MGILIESDMTSMSRGSSCVLLVNSQSFNEVSRDSNGRTSEDLGSDLVFTLPLDLENRDC